jgi:hypothetical protein
MRSGSRRRANAINAHRRGRFSPAVGGKKTSTHARVFKWRPGKSEKDDTCIPNPDGVDFIRYIAHPIVHGHPKAKRVE